MNKEFTVSEDRPRAIHKGRAPSPPTEFEASVMETLESGGSIVVRKLIPSEDTTLRLRVKYFNPNLKVHVSNQGDESHVWVEERSV